MNQRLSPLIAVLCVGFLPVLVGSSCNRTSGPSATANSGSPQAQLTPPSNPDGPTEVAPDIVPAGTKPGPDEAMILSVRKDVSLKRQGASGFVPILRNIAFRIGDLLQVGNDSAAKVLCSDRGICELETGTYSSCCSASCKVQIQMLRVGTGPTMPIVRKTDLPVVEAEQLNRAEASIRQLDLGPVTTQFLITKLYSGWKLEETNQELDRLTIQLKQPEAKQELQELYVPVIRKTGDMHLKLNRIGEAKDLYQININSQTNNSFEKAAAHEGLAQAYKQGGNKNEAVRNLEVAKDIYVKQGDTKAVAATEKEIANTKLERLDTMPKTRIRSQPPDQ